MRKQTDNLVFQFAVIFGIFTVIALILSGAMTYVNQTKSYKGQCLDNTRRIGDYLEQLAQNAGEEFIAYQDYYMAHFAEIDIPYNFTEYQTALDNYERIFADSGFDTPLSAQDLASNSVSPELKKAYLYFTYLHEYWLLTFEDARKSFGLPYTYYLVPKEDIFYMVYMIDGERSHRGEDGKMADEGEFLYLGDEYLDPYEEYRVQWDTWLSGERQNGFQIWNNAWGHTYAYYTPLIINGRKLGLIGTEVQVADVNKEILKNTLIQTASVGGMLVICIGLMLLFIHSHYIRKIVRLESALREYSAEKNPKIAAKIESGIQGADEISSLARQSAQLILEIESYIKSLLDTSQKLKDSQERADKMDVLANKDALTGIRNKNAYDSEVRRLEWQLSAGNTEFGIAMIDLNFLKRINDTFGHEQGNIAIKKLCYIVCHVFEHSPVFRIGGDEFVVILERADYKNVASLVADFNSQLKTLADDEELEPWEKVSASIGYALYDQRIDEGVMNVFRRADKAMYARKKEMKAVRES